MELGLWLHPIISLENPKFDIFMLHTVPCDIRTPEQHKEDCKLLKNDRSLSKEFGINRKSVLNKLKYFKVASGALVPDIMHDVLEGILLLQDLIQKKHWKP